MVETKNRILTAAVQLFCEKGVHATSVRDVMEKADAGKSQFYYYFSSKEDLVLEVIEAHFNHWQEECFREILQSDRTAVEALDRMLDWIYQEHERQQIYFGCPVGNLIIELAANDDEARKSLQNFYKEWTDLLVQRFIELGDKQPIIAAHQLIANIQGSILLLKLSQDLTILEENFNEIRKTISVKKI